jgi:DNA replication licensing factor MCM7
LGSANFQIPAAFEDFLKTYKTSTVEASDALSGLNLNDDELDEEYDFMDESGDESRPRRPDPKMKYMRMLQNVADRMTGQVIIDLDDLLAVRYENCARLCTRC